MGAILGREVSENDDWTITTDMSRAELYNYRLLCSANIHGAWMNQFTKEEVCQPYRWVAATQSAAIQSHPGKQD